MLNPQAYDAAMHRALVLAENGPAWGVNPQVGAVILDSKNRVIGEGWHRGSGTAHAEVAALEAALNASGGKLPSGCTAVVTLEPCNHTGKTGPCAQALIAAGIDRVVYGSTDPGQSSAGGAETLRNAGIETYANFMVEQADELIRPWATAMRLGRPHVIVKWATSLDGRTAATDGSSKWISGPDSREDSHERRASQDAILVGTATIIADDAELTARYSDGSLYEHQPLRVVLGERELPVTARVFNDRAETVQLATHDIKAALHELFDRGVRRLWVEGGPTVASAFLAEDLFDELVIYVAPMLLGGDRVATTDIGIGNIAQAKHLEIIEHRRLGDDILIRALRKPEHKEAN
jgi:diaminohydroxyphosphoribosylaminopyrimidine deaminase/5-amino-6-(5-phosphoribosylamino)uracil reductase